MKLDSNSSRHLLSYIPVKHAIHITDHLFAIEVLIAEYQCSNPGKDGTQCSIIKNQEKTKHVDNVRDILLTHMHWKQVGGIKQTACINISANLIKLPLMWQTI